jgi:hypothetical protein
MGKKKPHPNGYGVFLNKSLAMSYFDSIHPCISPSLRSGRCASLAVQIGYPADLSHGPCERRTSPAFEQKKSPDPKGRGIVLLKAQFARDAKINHFWQVRIDL